MLHHQLTHSHSGQAVYLPGNKQVQNPLHSPIKFGFLVREMMALCLTGSEIVKAEECVLDLKIFNFNKVLNNI